MCLVGLYGGLWVCAEEASLDPIDERSFGREESEVFEFVNHPL